MGFRTCWDERVYTDPYSADTDGDGLSDGEEIGRFVEEGSLAGGCYLLESDPTTVDSDGDGLSDYEETTEPVPYAVTASRNASLQVLRADEPSAMKEHLTMGAAWADPMRADTDGDGLDDREELVRRTNVAEADSDGDGTTDATDLAQGSDPTLFDARPPEVEVRLANFAGNEYRLVYVVEDPSGVKQTQLVKEGEKQYFASWRDGDLPRSTERDAYFETSTVESSISALTGTTVEVRATDGHDNQARTTGLERGNFFGRVADRVADEDTIYASEVAEQTGLVSGFAASLGGTARALEEFMDDPLGFLDGLRQLIALLDDLGLLDKLIEAFAQSFAEKQEQNNPYDESEHPELYERFKHNWYAGYAVGFVSKAAVGASATKIFKSTKTFQRVSKYVGSSRVGTVYKAAKSPVDAGKARVAAKIVKGADRASAPVLRRARSAGATYRLWRLQRRVDACSNGFTVARDCDGLFEGLSPDEQEQVGRVLARDDFDGGRLVRALDSPARKQALARYVDETGADGVNLLAQLDDDAARAMFRMDSRSTEFERWDDWRESLVDARYEGDASPDDIGEYANTIDTVSQRKNVENVQGLVDEVADNPRQLQDTALEADLVEKYSRSGAEVEVEPIKPIDLAVKQSDGSIKYIEAKNARSAIDKGKIERELLGAHKKFTERARREGLDIDETDERVVVFGARRYGTSMSIGKSRREIKNNLEELMQDVFPKNSNRPDGLEVDTIRIITNGRTFEFDVRTLYE
jgi:hypothetical protein